jgi:hypothetical protein
MCVCVRARGALAAARRLFSDYFFPSIPCSSGFISFSHIDGARAHTRSVVAGTLSPVCTYQLYTHTYTSRARIGTLFASCSAVCWPLLCVSRITRDVYTLYTYIEVHDDPPPPRRPTRARTRGPRGTFRFLYNARGWKAAAAVGISHKHQPAAAREERETGYFTLCYASPRAHRNLVKTHPRLFYIIAVKLLTHFSGPSNTGRRIPVRLYIIICTLRLRCPYIYIILYYIMIIIIIIVYYILLLYIRCSIPLLPTTDCRQPFAVQEMSRPYIIWYIVYMWCTNCVYLPTCQSVPAL